MSYSIRNLFDSKENNQMKQRIQNLTPQTKPNWGKMSVDQMLAHLNVAYEMDFTDKHPKPNAFARFMIKLFAKNTVVGPKPYPKNGRTAPQFIIEGARDFEKEKKLLLSNMDKFNQLGAIHYEGRESNSFGKLSSKEWNILYSKHLDHHLTQFGV